MLLAELGLAHCSNDRVTAFSTGPHRQKLAPSDFRPVADTESVADKPRAKAVATFSVAASLLGNTWHVKIKEDRHTN